jgi:hypothetical protein
LKSILWVGSHEGFKVQRAESEEQKAEDRRQKTEQMAYGLQFEASAFCFLLSAFCCVLCHLPSDFAILLRWSGSALNTREQF